MIYIYMIIRNYMLLGIIYIYIYIYVMLLLELYLVTIGAPRSGAGPPPAGGVVRKAPLLRVLLRLLH